MSKEDLMKNARLPDDFRNDLFAPVVNPTIPQEKKEEKPVEKKPAPITDEKPADTKPSTSKSTAKTKKSSATSKKTAQEPVSDDNEELVKMTYTLPLRQIEAIRLIAFNEGRMNYEVLQDLLDEVIPADVMKNAKLRVKNGVAKTSRKKK